MTQNTHLSFREKLIKHLAKIGGPPIKEALDHLGIRGSQQNNYFPAGTRGKKQIPIPILYIAALYVAYDINILDFICEGQQVDGKAMKRFIQKQDLITYFSPHYDKSVEVIHLPKLGNEEDYKMEFIKKYYPPMFNHANSAQKRLLVGEFLGKGNSILPGYYMEAYQWIHVDIFELIEHKLGYKVYPRKKSSAIRKVRNQLGRNLTINPLPLAEYKRILFLSVEDSVKFKEPREQIYRALFETSIPVFEHLCICIKHLSQKANFYARPLIRPHHYAIVVGKEEEDKTLISEYYKYRYQDGQQVAEPDILVFDKINHPKNPINKLYQSYLSDLDNKRNELGKIKEKHLSMFFEKSADLLTQYLKEKDLEAYEDNLRLILDKKKALYEDVFG